MEKALVLTLKDLLKTDYTEDIAHAWTELFGFMTVTMLAGKERAHELITNTGLHCRRNEES